MKKWGFLFVIFVFMVFVFAINCKSPATSEAADPFIAADAGSDSNVNADTGENGGNEGNSGDTTTALGSLTIMMKDKPVTADQVWVTISNIVVEAGIRVSRSSICSTSPE